MTPKTPMKNEPIDLSKQRIFTPDRNPITPVKPVDRQPQVEPWTPTANLKMLISAVSPEIRSRDQKRGLSDNRSALPEARDCLHVGLQGGWVAFGGLWMKGRSVWSPELLEGC